jgi:hypothetical protein
VSTVQPADPKTGGANPTMVRILRSTNDLSSQPEVLDGVSERLAEKIDLLAGNWNFWREIGIFSGKLEFLAGNWNFWPEIGIFTGNLIYWREI